MQQDRYEKIPATIVTGFLGAGKTTLIRHLITHAGERRIALIVNEFGDVGVDGELLRGCNEGACADGDIIELANGCICCTVADDFIPTMEKLLERDEPPEFIVIETSGLALPQPLVRAFNWPQIKTCVTVDGVITLVDAAALAAGQFASDEEAVDRQRRADDMLDHETPLGELFEDQLSCADLVVLGKTDLVSVGKLEKIEQFIGRETGNGVQIVRASHGVLPPELLIGLDAGAENDGRLSHHERHHSNSANGEPHHHDHDAFETFALHLPQIDDVAGFEARLMQCIRSHGILRLKGFMAVNGKPMRRIVQAVGPRLESYFDRDWQADEPRQTRFVVIGLSGLDKNAISTALGAT